MHSIYNVKIGKIVKSFFGLIEDVQHPFLQDYSVSDEEDANNDSDSQQKYSSKSPHSPSQQNYIYQSPSSQTNTTCCGRVIDYMYAILEMPHGKTPLIGRIVNFILFSLVIISIASFIISTEDFVINNMKAVRAMQGIELICALIFIFEYVGRFIACTSSLGPYAKYGQVFGRLRFLVSMSSIIDIISTIPSLTLIIIEFFQDKQGRKVVAYRGFLALRILRVLRLLKAEKYFKASVIIKNVILRKRRELLIAAFVYIVTVLITGTAIFIAEDGAQPTEYGSIIAGIYWACIALSTGNIGAVPITPLGKLINVVVSVSAVALVAIPTSILGAGFVEELEMRVAEAKEVEEQKKKQQEAELQDKKIDSVSIVAQDVSVSNSAVKVLKCPHCEKQIQAKMDISLQ